MPLVPVLPVVPSTTSSPSFALVLHSVGGLVFRVKGVPGSTIVPRLRLSSWGGKQGVGGLFVEDEAGGVYVVDENWVDKFFVDDEGQNGSGFVDDENVEYGRSAYKDMPTFEDEDGGVFFVEDDGEDSNAGDGSSPEFDGEIKLIDSEDDILNLGDLNMLSPHEIQNWEFANMDVAFKFYFEYAKANGFSIRRGRTLRNKKTLEEYQKEFWCSRAGTREDRGLRMEDRVREPRPITRWSVHCSMLPAYRRMVDSDVVQMNNMMKVGIRPPNIFSTFASQSGGYEKIGFRKKNMYNKINEQRRKGKFFGGFRTTSRCEGLHSELEKFVHSRYNLGDFLQHFHRCLSHMRFREKEDDFTSIHGDPIMQTQMQSLESFVARVYTRRDFFLFRRVLHRASMLVINGYTQVVRCTIFKVRGNSDNSVECSVLLYPSSKEFKCGCLKMESIGLPCEHIFVVLGFLGIHEIPDSLVLKRWSKGAKDGICLGVGENNEPWDAGRSARRAALNGLYNDVSAFKAATIEKFNLERERILADLRECRAEKAAEQERCGPSSNVANDTVRNLCVYLRREVVLHHLPPA
ncbi:Zinc finger, SWIM-type [Sesbania bispinosa]|nr:Zinc finger, SWIM-type [Sesbania bispinosa]